MGLRTSLQVLGDDHQLAFEWARISGPAETPKSPPQDPVTCPRCGSTKTKFCYYNNYNKSQPRHFCKSCKRHWTKGGTIRNVPAGGGRRNKRRRIPTAAAAEPPQQHCRNIPSTNDTTGITDQVPFSNVGNAIDVNSAMVNSDQINDYYYPWDNNNNNNQINDYYYPWDNNNNNNNLDYSIEESTISSLDIPTNYWNWNWNEMDIAWVDIYAGAKP